MKYLFYIVWRIWFYTLILLTIVIALPVLLVVISREAWYGAFYTIARLWGKTILYGMGFWPRLLSEMRTKPGKSYMFIANHTSMVDIMLMLAVVRSPIVFVGKEELTKIPLFGYVFKRTSITVDRSNLNSRKEVYIEAQRRLKQGLSMCIFPEGLVPDDERVVLSEFKNGAFRLAIEHQIPIVPLVFYYCKKRFSYTFFSGKPGSLRVRALPLMETEGMRPDDLQSLKDIAFDKIHAALLNDMNND
jgi:1-acyl-sn-glycerol-3-phosphate acyltransferase